jgi:hypothetical protein
MLRFARFFAVCLILTALAGCTVVGSVHPLSDAKTSIDDDRLVGQWVPVDPKTKAPSNDERMEIRKAAEGHAYDAVSANKEEQITIFVAEIGKRRFLSAPLKDDPAAVRYMIMQYELRDDELQFFFLHPSKAAEAIAKGQIEGTVTREKPSGDDPNAQGNLKEVVLTASSDKLRAFLGSKEGQAIVYTDEPTMMLKRAPK